MQLYPEPAPKLLPPPTSPGPYLSRTCPDSSQTSFWTPAAQGDPVSPPTWASSGCERGARGTKTPAPSNTHLQLLFIHPSTYACAQRAPGTALPLCSPESAAAPSTHLDILRQYQGPRTAHAPILPKCQCMCRARPWPSQVQNPKLQTGALRPLLQQPPHRGHPSRFPPPAGTPTHAERAHTQNLHPGPEPSASLGHCASSRS